MLSKADFKRYFEEHPYTTERVVINPKENKVEYLRKRTVRVLIEECGLSPCEAGKEYSRRTLSYNIAADYTFPYKTWEEARRDIVKVYRGQP